MEHDATANHPLWHSPALAPRPVLVGSVRADACVIGLGGSGLAAIGQLLDRGLRVVGLDAGEVAGRAAGRNGGLLIAGIAEFHHDAVARFGHARAVRLYRKTLDWLPVVGRHAAPIVRWTGSLRIAASAEEERDCRAQFDQMTADGFPVEWYDGPEGRGLHLPTDGVCQPMVRCRVLATQAEERGAVLFEHSPVIALERGRVATTHGVVQCDTVIVAVDGGLLTLLPELAGRVRPVRLQMLGTAPNAGVRIDRPVSYRYAFDYWQQLPDGRVVIGGGRDHFEAESETADDTPTTTVQAHLERVLRDHLGVRAPITHRWAAQVSYTPDYLPIMDEVRPGVWVAGAYSGTGNVVGPICAEAVVRAALDGDRRGIDDWIVP